MNSEETEIRDPEKANFKHSNHKNQKMNDEIVPQNGQNDENNLVSN